MGIGLSGMISGLDTDSIVKAMVSAQRTKATKIENKITKNKWTTELWSATNTKIYSFYTKYASKLRLQSSYMTRTASSSRESAVKTSATSAAAVGTHTLKIRQLASSQYVTGAKISAAADTYNRNTKLTQIGEDANRMKEGTILSIKGKLGTAAEKEVKLEVTADTTINDFLNACKEAGLSASFDATQQRFFISSSQSGKDDAFSITTSELSQGAAAELDTIAGKINASALSEDEQRAYADALATVRGNTELLATVTAEDYDNATAGKAEKKVYAAVQTIQETAAKAYAQGVAEKTVFDRLNAIISNAGQGGTFTAYETEYDYDVLRDEAETIVKNNYERNAGTEALKKLQSYLEGNEISLGENYCDLASVTPAKIASLEKSMEALFAPAGTDENGEPTDAGKLADSGLSAADLSAADLGQLKEQYQLTEEELDAIRLNNTWNYEWTDAESGTTVSAQELYDTALADRLADTTQYEKEVQTEMLATVAADHEAAYEAEIAEERELLLADESNTELASLRSELQTSLQTVAAAGTIASANGMSALGLGEITGAAVRTEDANGDSVGMVVVAAQNAKVVLDGSTMEESSNSFTINGVHMDLISTTYNKDTGEYDDVQITVGKDVDSTYQLIKEALSEYNKLIEELNTMYYADSARGYEPLTDEQKDAMSDTEVETWEKKIKDSLLRRDDTLGTLLSSMRTALSASYTDEDGKSYTLSNYGIVTGTYTERGKLHIYGDSEDTDYATYTNRLKAALEEDPDKVMEVMTNIFGGLYTTMTEKCAKTELSSALTFYNDVQYKNTLSDYEGDLEKMEDRISELEDRYYKQFTTMETALSKLQSQTNSLASLLGTSNS